MDGRRKYLALINPISGNGKKDYLPEVLEKRFDGHDITIRFTQRPNHAYDLAKAAAADGYYAVIAVGGDGTVNETASHTKRFRKRACQTSAHTNGHKQSH